MDKEGTDYELLGKIGEGAFSYVHAARPRNGPRAGQRIALKILKPELLRSPQTVFRFISESAALQEIDHPNIVHVFDAGRIELDGRETYCFEMELLEGELLSEHRERVGKMEEGEIRRIALQICEALSEIHSRDIVYRDLKPENVFILHDGTVKLMDFSAVKLLALDSKATFVGDVVGTPLTMAPEQMRDSSTVDCRADHYSLGVILYLMMTGDYPDWAPNEYVLASKRLSQLPTVTVPGGGYSEALKWLVTRLLSPDPRRRINSIERVARILRRRGGNSLRWWLMNRWQGFAYHLLRWQRVLRWAAGLTLIALVLLVISRAVAAIVLGTSTITISPVAYYAGNAWQLSDVPFILERQGLLRERKVATGTDPALRLTRGKWKVSWEDTDLYFGGSTEIELGAEDVALPLILNRKVNWRVEQRGAEALLPRTVEVQDLDDDGGLEVYGLSQDGAVRAYSAVNGELKLASAPSASPPIYLSPYSLGGRLILIRLTQSGDITFINPKSGKTERKYQVGERLVDLYRGNVHLILPSGESLPMVTEAGELVIFAPETGEIEKTGRIVPQAQSTAVWVASNSRFYLEQTLSGSVGSRFLTLPELKVIAESKPQAPVKAGPIPYLYKQRAVIAVVQENTFRVVDVTTADDVFFTRLAEVPAGMGAFILPVTNAEHESLVAVARGKTVELVDLDAEKVAWKTVVPALATRASHDSDRDSVVISMENSKVLWAKRSSGEIVRQITLDRPAKAAWIQDMDSDGSSELFADMWDSTGVVVDLDQEPPVRTSIGIASGAAERRIFGDFDADGYLELLMSQSPGSGNTPGMLMVKELVPRGSPIVGQLEYAVMSTPTVARMDDGGSIGVVATFFGELYAFNPATGEESWYTRTPLREVFSSPLVVPGESLVVLASYRTRSIAGYDLRTGEEKWIHRLPGRIGTTPALYRTSIGRWQLLFPDQEGFLNVADASSGELIKRLEIGSASFSTPAPFPQEPAKFIFGADDGRLRVYDAEAEELTETGMIAPDRVLISPIVVDADRGDSQNVLVVTWTGDVVAFDSQTEKELWRTSLGSTVFRQPFCYWQEDIVTVGTFDGRVTGIDCDSGVLRWEQLFDSPVKSVIKGVDINRDGIPEAIVATGSGELTALELAGGRRVATWSFSGEIAGGAVPLFGDDHSLRYLLVAARDGFVYRAALTRKVAETF